MNVLLLQPFRLATEEMFTTNKIIGKNQVMLTWFFFVHGGAKMNKEDYQKLMEQAKKVTITSVMDEQGMDYIDMRNFAQSVEHDSLMIDKRKNRFYWNSQIEDGKVVSGDTIDFVKRFFNKSHMEALTYLAEEEHEKLTTQEKWQNLKNRFNIIFNTPIPFKKQEIIL